MPVGVRRFPSPGKSRLSRGMQRMPWLAHRGCRTKSSLAASSVQRRVSPCVDGPWNARLLYRWDRSGSVMCPAFYRGIVATGPDEVRGWRANQFVELKALGEPRLCSIPGPTGSPSLLSPSFLRSTIAEPDSFKRLRAGKSPLFSEEPTRRGRSCLRSLPTPCVPVCAARASRSMGMMGHQCAPVV